MWFDVRSSVFRGTLNWDIRVRGWVRSPNNPVVLTTVFSKNSLKIPYVDPQEIILAAQAWHDKKKNGTSKHVFMEFTTNIKTERKWKTGIFILE